MTDEELIEQLRDSKGWQNLGNAAAQRIEQLSAQLKMVLEREAETQRRHEAREDNIHEAALREAEAVAWIHGYEMTNDVQQRILDLIGEKK